MISWATGFGVYCVFFIQSNVLCLREKLIILSLKITVFKKIHPLRQLHSQAKLFTSANKSLDPQKKTAEKRATFVVSWWQVFEVHKEKFFKDLHALQIILFSISLFWALRRIFLLTFIFNYKIISFALKHSVFDWIKIHKINSITGQMLLSSVFNTLHIANLDFVH